MMTHFNIIITHLVFLFAIIYLDNCTAIQPLDVKPCEPAVEMKKPKRRSFKVAKDK